MSLPRPLIERFVRHLAEVSEEVATLQAQIDAGGDGFEPLRAAAHKLAGTAGAFGFPAVGDQARQVEQAVLAGAPWTPTLASLTQALHLALVNAAQTELS